jgi:acetylornithine aminotransferase
MQPGNHGSTFGGNPLACAAALATVETLLSDEIRTRVSELSTLFRDRFVDLYELDQVKEIRQNGLMIGIELSHDCGELVEKAKEKGILINVTAGRVIRLLPPFVLSNEEANTIADVVIQLVHEFELEPAL